MSRPKRHPVIGFALIAGGSLLAILTLHNCWVWQQCQNWKPIRAAVVSAEIVAATHSGRGGSNSFSLHLEYEYDWRGKRYQSTAASPFDWIEVSERQKRMQAQSVRQDGKRDGGVTCFVNPDRPSQSVIFRSFRAVPVIIFGLVALTFISAGILVVRQQRGHR